MPSRLGADLAGREDTAVATPLHHTTKADARFHPVRVSPLLRGTHRGAKGAGTLREIRHCASRASPLPCIRLYLECHSAPNAPRLVDPYLVWYNLVYLLSVVFGVRYP